MGLVSCVGSGQGNWKSILIQSTFLVSGVALTILGGLKLSSVVNLRGINSSVFIGTGAGLVGFLSVYHLVYCVKQRCDRNSTSRAQEFPIVQADGTAASDTNKSAEITVAQGDGTAAADANKPAEITVAQGDGTAALGTKPSAIITITEKDEAEGMGARDTIPVYNKTTSKGTQAGETAASDPNETVEITIAEEGHAEAGVGSGTIRLHTNTTTQGTQTEETPRDWDACIKVNEAEHIPIEDFKELVIFLERFKSWPKAIEEGNLLKQVSFSGKQITALPEAFKYLRSLMMIVIHDSPQLTSLPDVFGGFSDLRVFQCFGSGLTNLPDSICKLKELKDVRIVQTSLSRLPDKFGDLTKLIKLHLHSNKLTQVPPSVGNLENLTELVLSNNQLTSLPETLGSLKNLTTLGLDNNPRLNVLPKSFSKLKLKELALAETAITMDALPPKFRSSQPKKKVVAVEHIRINPPAARS